MATNQIPLGTSVGGDIIDENTDLRTVEVPDPTNVTLVRVWVSSMTPAVGSPTIEVRNTASGGGSGITVTFTDGNTEASNTGSITITDYLYVRSGTCGGLSDINVVPFVVWS